MRLVRAVALVAAALPAWASRGDPPAAPADPVRAAPGVVVRYEERANPNVVYLEQKGGLQSSVATPVPDARRAMPAARPAPAVDPVTASAQAARARAAPRAGVRARP